MSLTFTRDTFKDFESPDIDARALNNISAIIDDICKNGNVRTLGSLDANTIMQVALSDLVRVSLTGLGTSTSVAITNCDTQILNGMFTVATGITGWAFTSSFAGFIIHAGGNNAIRIQVAFAADPVSFQIGIRTFSSSVWNDWFYINSKVEPISNKIGTTTLGYFNAVDCTYGSQVTLPTGGTYEWFVSTYGATYNSTKSGVSSGGLMTGTASANLTMYYKKLT